MRERERETWKEREREIDTQRERERGKEREREIETLESKLNIRRFIVANISYLHI